MWAGDVVGRSPHNVVQFATCALRIQLILLSRMDQAVGSVKVAKANEKKPFDTSCVASHR